VRRETEPEKRDKKVNTELRLVKDKFRIGSQIEKVRVGRERDTEIERKEVCREAESVVGETELEKKRRSI
jgi:hypothetical protein